MKQVPGQWFPVAARFHGRQVLGLQALVLSASAGAKRIGILGSSLLQRIEFRGQVDLASGRLSPCVFSHRHQHRQSQRRSRLVQREIAQQQRWHQRSDSGIAASDSSTESATHQRQRPQLLRRAPKSRPPPAALITIRPFRPAFNSVRWRRRNAVQHNAHRWVAAVGQGIFVAPAGPGANASPDGGELPTPHLPDNPAVRGGGGSVQ